MARQAKIDRKTNETSISLSLTLDGKGDRRIATPVPFFNHMLEAVARHGLYDLQVDATGDVEVDAHHTVEDVGICLGQAFHQALGDKTRHHPLRRRRPSPWTRRWSRRRWTSAAARRSSTALTRSRGGWVGTFDAELAREFFGGFVSTALCNLHLEVRYGENAHHIVEALFKAFARATARGGAPGPARGGRAIDQGDAHLRERPRVSRRRHGQRQPAQRGEGAGRGRRQRHGQRRRRRRRPRRQAGRARPGGVRRLRGRAGPRRRRRCARRCSRSSRGGRPFFGICIGMQMLFDSSEENPDCARPGRSCRGASAASPPPRA